MRMVEGWKTCWRWWSVRGLAVLAAVPPAWVMLPDDVKIMLPEAWRPWVVSTIAVATLVGRLKSQDPA